MSRATDALLATVGAIGPEDLVANDEVSTEIAIAERPLPGEGVELATWIDALAMTLAAGLRVGARGLATITPSPIAPNEEIPAGDPDADVLTVDDVAALLRVGRNAVYESVGRGEIPHRRIGKQIRFSRQGIMRWLASWSSQGAKEDT